MEYRAIPSSVVVAIIAAVAALFAGAAAGAQLAPEPMIGQSGCETRCGNVRVPFPFGFGPARCSTTGFNLTCDNTTRPGKPRLLLGNGGIFEVREISIEKKTVRVVTPPIFSGVRNLSSSPGDVMRKSWGARDLDQKYRTYYLLSQSDSSVGSELVVAGCNVEATLHTKITGDGRSYRRNYGVSCSAYCTGDRPFTAEDVRKNYTGICISPIGTENTYFDVELKRLPGEHGTINDDLPVSVLIVDGDTFESDLPEQVVHLMNLDRPPGARHLPRPKNDEDGDQLLVPVILGWDCYNIESCNASLSSNSNCAVFDAEMSFQCKCSPGYKGNPYVTGGCQDINECKHPEEYPCSGVCGNKNGSFDCWCPRGYKGNASLPNGCIESVKNTGLIIGLSVSVIPCVVLLAIGGILIIRKFEHYKAERMKQKFFKQNRGQLLQQLVSNRSDIGERMIIPLKELLKATNDFDQTRKLGGGGHGTVYKGILSDLHVVAIKKSNIVVQREIDEFINEVAILSQINHRNIVKLHGCCLETEVPLLAYEFICNGTLADHLYNGSQRSISWRDRLRIAGEVGKAIAYLHSSISAPIIHRDIKSSNVLLDDALTAKVSDFGASRYIPIDQTGITATAVQGTIGYLDPMYYYTGRLSEMSDVYSFGVLLVELLTRKEPIKYRSSEGEGLVMQFVELLEQGSLMDILDSQVVEEGNSEVEKVASLAASCLKLKGEERPTMRHIEMALEGLQPTNDRALIDSGAEQNEQNYITPSYRSTRRSASLEEVSRQYSQEEEFTLSARYPR